jgi:hypothetical protein
MFTPRGQSSPSGANPSGKNWPQRVAHLKKQLSNGTLSQKALLKMKTTQYLFT